MCRSEKLGVAEIKKSYFSSVFEAAPLEGWLGVFFL